MFEQRARGSEFLDRPDADPRLVEQSYKFMKVVNRIGGGIRVVRTFLEQELSRKGSEKPDGHTVPAGWRPQADSCLPRNASRLRGGKLGPAQAGVGYALPRGEGVPPLRVAGIVPAIRGQGEPKRDLSRLGTRDARAPKEPSPRLSALTMPPVRSRKMAAPASQTPPEALRADTVTVLDLGAADCDIPLALTRWADRRGHRIEFTCLDHDAKAVELAQRQIARCNCRTVQAVQADIFTYRPADGFDYAVGSMTFHHFTDDEIDRLILHLRGFVRKALLINDLHRCLFNYIVCFVLALPLDPRIRHDGLLSIRRGFKPQELARMLAKHDPTPAVRRAWFCRVAGVVRFDRESHG